MKFVKNALNSTSYGKLVKNVGVLCPSRLKEDGLSVLKDIGNKMPYHYKPKKGKKKKKNGKKRKK